MSTVSPLPHSSLTRSGISRPASVAVAAAVIALAMVAFIAWVPLSARAARISPLDAGGALVQVRDDAVFDRTSALGPVAVGGNLAFRGPSVISGGSVATETTGGSSRDVQLFVAGAVEFGYSSGRLAVDGDGGIAIGDLSGTDVTDDGPELLLRPAGFDPGADPETVPVVRGGFDQAAADVAAADLALDLDARFVDYLARSTALAGCAATVTVDADGQTVYLEEGVTNVWNVDEVTLDAIRPIRFVPAPSETTKLIVNVTRARGDISFPKGMTNAISAHVLYNVVGSGSIRLTGLWPMRGTLYAPGFDVTSINPKGIEGNVVTRSFRYVDDESRGAGALIKDFGFIGAVECGPPAEPSPTASTTGVSTASTVPPVVSTPSTTSSSSSEPTSTSSPATTDHSTATSTSAATDSGSGSASTSVTSTTSTAGTSSASTPTSSSSSTGTGSTSGPTPATPATQTSASVVTTGTPGVPVASSTTVPATTVIPTTTVTPPTTLIPTTLTLPMTTPIPTLGTVVSPPSTTGVATTSGSSGSTTATSGASGPLPSTTPSSGAVTSGSQSPGASSAPSSAGVVPTTSPSSSTSSTPSVATGESTSGAGSGDPASGPPPGTPLAGASLGSATTPSIGSASTTSAGAAVPGLPLTGADVAGLVLTGVGLLAAGFGMMWTARRQGGRHMA